jgi:hypothetical protein
MLFMDKYYNLRWGGRAFLTFHSSPQGLKLYKHNFIKDKTKIQLREFSG